MGKNSIDQRHVLALDIGTSSVRAILFDSRGEIVAAEGIGALEAQVKYAQQTTSDGGVEVDAEELLAMTVRCLADVLGKTRKQKITISGVGVSCFWHSVLGVSASGKAVTPVYSWADTRSAGSVPELRKLFGIDSYHQITGAELHPCFWPAKLIWLRREHPSLYNQSKHWMGFAEYMMLRMFGSNRSSLSMASGTGLFNQQKATWDESVLDRLELDASLLSELDDALPAHGLKAEFQGALAGLEDIPWFSAVGDGACSNIGSGGTDDRRIVLNIGTSAAMRVVVRVDDKAPVKIRKGLFCYRVDQKHAIIGGAFANGGNAYAWLKDILQWPDDKAFSRTVADVKPDGHGLTVLPFWAGERSPGWCEDARASIIGMNLNTSRADIVRAALESVAYSFDEVRESLMEEFPQAKEIAISGGAVASSPLLGQIIADLFGVPLVTTKVAEASSRGAALIALEGIGAIESWSDAPVGRGRSLKPNQQHHVVYAAGARRFRKYYDSTIKLTTQG